MPLGQSSDWIRTFHGLGRALLNRHGADIGLSPHAKQVEDTAIWILLKRNIELFNFKYYKQLGQSHKHLADLQKHFSRLKDENISAEDYKKFASAQVESAKGLDEEIEVERVVELAEAYQVYNKILLDNSCLDYGDLLCYSIKLLKERPNILAAWRKQFKYIMVDEFQDTNRAQYELVKLLAGEEANLAVVGDDDQAIYKFRGASLSNIMQFKADYPQAKTVVMIDNYRSGQNILDAAYRFISHNNPDRLEIKENIDKRLVAHLPEAGTITAWDFPDSLAEASAVATEIVALHKSGEMDWKDMAVLFRSHAAADRFVKEFSRLNIPYQYLAHGGLYYRPIVLQLINYLRLLDNYHESMALYKSLSSPSFIMEHLDVLELSRVAREHQWSLFEALKHVVHEPTSKISAGGLVSAGNLLAMIEKHTVIAKEKAISVLIANIVNDIFYPHLDRDRDWPQFRLLGQIYAKAVTLEESIADARLKDFVELIDSELEAGDSGRMPVIIDDADTVKLVTVHSAKGLEYKYVFMADLVDRRFPSNDRGDKIPLPEGLGTESVGNSEHHLQEERRLFYVGMTRAAKGLYLTSYRDSGGKLAKKPSKFIPEIGGIVTTSFDFDTTGTPLDRAIERLDEPALITPPIPLPTKFSYSALETYNHCPLQFKFRHLLKLPIEKKGLTGFGDMMHKILEEFLTPLLPSGEELSEEALSEERFLRVYEKYWTSAGYETKQEAQEHYQLGKKYGRRFLEVMKAKGRPKLLGLEVGFEFALGEWTIYSKVDRVDELPDGTLRLIDYKTGEPMEKPIYDKIKQLLLYKIGVEKKYGRPVSSLVYYQFKAEDEWLEFAPNPKEVIKLEEEMLATIKEIQKGNFAHKPGFLCRYCDFRNACEFAQN